VSDHNKAMALEDEIEELQDENKVLKESMDELLGIVIELRKTLVDGGLKENKPYIRFIDSLIQKAKV